MAFSKKTWLDRIAEYPTRRRLKKSDGTDEIVSVSREEGAISQEGDAFSAANMNDLEDRVASEFNSLNLKLGKVYNDTTVITKNIPAAKKTTFIRFNNIDFGTYIVFAKVSLTTTQPTGGALLSLEINNSAFVEEVPNINFLGSATVCGYAVISKTTDSISASYYSINSVTISSAELVAIRIS